VSLKFSPKLKVKCYFFTDILKKKKKQNWFSFALFIELNLQVGKCVGHLLARRKPAGLCFVSAGRHPCNWHRFGKRDEVLGQKEESEKDVNM